MFTVQIQIGGKWCEHLTTDDRDLAEAKRYFLHVEGWFSRIVRNE